MWWRVPTRPLQWPLSAGSTTTFSDRSFYLPWQLQYKTCIVLDSVLTSKRFLTFSISAWIFLNQIQYIKKKKKNVYFVHVRAFEPINFTMFTFDVHRTRIRCKTWIFKNRYSYVHLLGMKLFLAVNGVGRFDGRYSSSFKRMRIR